MEPSGGLLKELLAWNDAGPVAILMFSLVMVTWVAIYLLRQLLKEKSEQIRRANQLTDRAVDEIGDTLDNILEALRDRPPPASPRSGRGSR